MKAGRELDALIEVEIFERCAHYLLRDVRGDNGGDYITWTCKHCDKEFRGLAYSKGYRHPALRHYSTQIADAWLVVEKLSKENYGFGIYITTIIDLDGGLHDNWGCYFENDDFEWEVEEEAAPLAICLAALKAVEGGDV